MKIFLVRHGNTFGDDQEGGKRIFMSGSKNNIPLVNAGREQARNMGKYFIQNNITPTVIYANHLIRIWEHAALIRECFFYECNKKIPLRLNEDLLELDYGNWAGVGSDGKTAENNEVIAKFGQEAWDNWQKRRIIPNDPPHSWAVTREDIETRLRAFFNMLRANHQQDDIILAVGSQGSLTFINALIPGGMDAAIAEDRYKVKTGRFCELENDGKNLKLIRWNEKAENA